ncbi:hypothetical protein ABJB81_006081 [Pseudomonas putida]|uniref:hypothetical protein n=1 Tax=Pseudomonas TaxID=286 RepID=UPI0006DB16BA|nr:MULTISPECIES: hypothetical protein [Pseudomonas]KPM64132.1 hypothetical protein HB4184_11020 [Pseudomonas putida]MCE1084667.1 hypothetical protein [Pseudomonas asiatica]MCF3156621.1 hypothetical protein [Pseudomonas juntendi]
MTIDKEEIKALALACAPSKCADEAEEDRRLAEFHSELTPEAILALLAEIDQLGAERELFLLAGKSLKDDVVRLKAENEALRSALLEASEEVATWGAYASEYFQEKHDLAGCVAKIHAAAMAKEASHDHE